MSSPMTVTSRKKLQEELVSTTRQWRFFEVHAHHWVPLKGLRVLDVGMGQGPLGVVALSEGVASYTGLDPALRINEKPRVRNIGVYHGGVMYKEFPFSGQDMMNAYPGKLTLLPGTFETVHSDALAAGNFDVATMFSVTEHLPNNRLVLAGIYRILRPGQALVFSHHNYYGYSGHHRLPKKHSDFDANNINHTQVARWRHLEPDSPAYSDHGLNRIRLGDLMAIANVYFDCAYRIRTGVGDKAALTSELFERLHKRGFSRGELLAYRLAVACVRRADSLPAPWLDTLPVHHPTTDGSYVPQPLPSKVEKLTGSSVIQSVPKRLDRLRHFLDIL